MSIHNSEIADKFDRLANLLAIEGANGFRVRAYRNAARTLRSHSRSMVDLLEKGEDLAKLPGIGEDLASKIKTVVNTGKLPLLEEVESRTPAALNELTQLAGLGPQRVRVLYEKLNLRSLEDLETAARQGRIRELAGFGAKTEKMIKARIASFTGAPRRTKLIEAEDIAKPLLNYLKTVKGIKDLCVAGSYRRRQETVGDLDILVTAQQDAPVMQHFVGYDDVEEVLAQGKTRSTVRLRCGMQVDLRLVPQASYGAALYYFTGSKAHNIAVRKIAVRKKLKLNEYGVFRGEKRIAGKSEQQVFDCAGLPYIAPELRENRGEIEAARNDALPRLITLDDIRGDLHCHTKQTDGRHSLADMVEAARQRAYEYIAITDHSRRLGVAHGLDKKRLLAQIRKIDKLNEKSGEVVVLKSIEVDILEDGKLDLPDEALKELDFTVCSVHYKFGLSRVAQTERILRAMDNRYFNILGHPSGRLINEREPYQIDLERIMKAARERGCILELNAQPDRLDLDADACRMAKEAGVKVAISTDAHSKSDLAHMRFGIGQARRGWLDASDVVNTHKLGELKKLLTRR